jgi:hypothetical protein
MSGVVAQDSPVCMEVTEAVVVAAVVVVVRT